MTALKIVYDLKEKSLKAELTVAGLATLIVTASAVAYVIFFT